MGQPSRTKAGFEKEETSKLDKLKGDYYYDDAHGYEIYIPEIDDDSNDPSEKKPDRENDPASFNAVKESTF